MAISKIQAESMNLADTYAFTGTVTGAGGITMVDQWRTTSNISSDTDPITNLERNDSAYFSKIGSGMSESSGTFTFPQTGIYQIYIQSRAQAAQDTAFLSIKLTTNNSSYSESSYGTISLIDAGSGALAQAGIFASIIFDVTDTTTHKCRFATGSMSNAVFYGDTNTSLTAFTFIRLGDT